MRIADSLDGEIVNCDSMQIYRGFDIGTAKLTFAERGGIPHHLIDCVDPETRFSAGDYARAARPLLKQIAARGRVPLVVGGTGFYLRALLDGLPDLPPQNLQIRERLSQWNGERLWKLLKRLDAPASLRLLPQDRMRVTRALEIRLLLGHAPPPFEKRPEFADHTIRKIALIPPREELYRRLDDRTRQMFEAGLVDEVRGLLSAGLPPTTKTFDAVGYRQALAVVENRSSLEEAITAAQQATRNYAKRQITWFRHDTGVEIYAHFGSEVHQIPGLFTEKKRNHPLPSSNPL